MFEVLSSDTLKRGPRWGLRKLVLALSFNGDSITRSSGNVKMLKAVGCPGDISLAASVATVEITKWLINKTIINSRFSLQTIVLPKKGTHSP